MVGQRHEHVDVARCGIELRHHAAASHRGRCGGGQADDVGGVHDIGVLADQCRGVEARQHDAADADGRHNVNCIVRSNVRPGVIDVGDDGTANGINADRDIGGVHHRGPVGQAAGALAAEDAILSANSQERVAVGVRPSVQGANDCRGGLGDELGPPAKLLR